MPIEKPELTLDAEARQLAFNLELPEVETDGISPEQARERLEAARHALEALRNEKGSPAWLEDVFALMDSGWPFRQATYMAWASSPKLNREPKTQDELARKYLGLNSDRAISTWRKKNPNIDTVIGILQSAPLWESRADDFKALADGAAKAGEDYKFFNHLKLAMEMRGDYIPKSELEALLKRKAAPGAESKTMDELVKLAGYEDATPGEETEA
jgi:hypothetical protein